MQCALSDKLQNSILIKSYVKMMTTSNLLMRVCFHMNYFYDYLKASWADKIMSDMNIMVDKTMYKNPAFSCAQEYQNNAVLRFLVPFKLVMQSTKALTN